MDSWGESDLAWHLAELISAVLADSDRTLLYGAIGAGESYCAINTTLQAMVHQRVPLSPELIAKLAAWIDGYAHSRDAARLRQSLRTITAFS